jgi:hypothetical protein
VPYKNKAKRYVPILEPTLAKGRSPTTATTSFGFASEAVGDAGDIDWCLVELMMGQKASNA